MQIIDTFSGIGGFSLAGRWIGWRTIHFCEIDPWCHKVLKKHWPNVPIHTDIKTLTPEIIKQNPLYDENEETIITGGVPCQPASTAGKRRGESDERWLWPQTIKFIGEFRPTLAVLENVAGLVSMENGKTLDRILSDLEDEGYTTEQVIIPACAVGAWHRRDRIWIVCYNTNITDPLRKRYSVTTGGEDYKKKWAVCKEEQSNGDRIWPEINGHSNLIANPISQRGCSRNTGGEYAEDVRQQPGGEEHGYWDTEPSVGRVANGIPNRVDRLKGLGNAIVPQVALQLFKAIAEYKNI